MKLLSIIIPVFNVENYIEECLESIVPYLNSNVELILINDGATDSSRERVIPYLNLNTNIIVVDQKNKGLSASRNVGISKSTGKYLWFVDSDDFLQIGAIDSILDVISKQSPEIIAIDVTILSDSDNVQKVVSRSLPPNVNIQSKFLYRKGFIYPFTGAQYYIVQKSFLTQNNISFYEGIYFEDELYSTFLLTKSHQIFYLKESLYVYRLRKGSITASISTIKKCKDMITVMDNIYSLYVDERNNNRDGFIPKSMILKKLSVLYRYLYYPLGSKEEKKTIRKLIRDRSYLLTEVIKSCNLKYIIRYLLLVI